MRSIINKVLLAPFIFLSISGIFSCSSNKKRNNYSESSGGTQKFEICDKFSIYYNKRTDTYIYKKRNTGKACLVYHNAADGKYYIEANTNINSKQLTYRPPGYNERETALMAAMFTDRIITLGDDLRMNDRNGNIVSIKNSVKTICD